MTLNWGNEPSGATPLGPEEFDLLIPTDVATRADLNAVERDNILSARIWAFSQRGIVDADTLRPGHLHHSMQLADGGDYAALIAYAAD